MNEQEWANRYNDDLDAILRGELPDAQASTEEYQEMLALSQTFSTLDMSGESRIHRTLKRDLLTAPPRKWQGWLSLGGNQMMNWELKQMNRNKLVGRLAMAGIALALVGAAAFSIPVVRASAAVLFAFFTPGASDTLPVLPTVLPPTQGAIETAEQVEMLTGLSFNEVIATVEQDEVFGYEVQEPNVLPAGFVYEDGMVDSFGRMVVLIYVCEDRQADLSLTMRGLANPNPMVDPSTSLPVGSSADIESVDLNGIAAEYVHGDFDVDFNWNSALPYQTLAWEHNQVVYRLRSHVQFGSACSVSQGDLIAMAESLLP